MLGFSITFGESNSGIIGKLNYACMINVTQVPHSYYGQTIPFALFYFFQLMFATITPALMVGSVIGRVNLKSLILFVVLWSLTVYCPIAHWMWN